MNKANSKRYETRGVLAGAYRGKDIEARALLTHLYFPETGRSGCRQPGDRLVDEYGHTARELASRPTCPVCAKRWDRLEAAYIPPVLRVA